MFKKKKKRRLVRNIPAMLVGMGLCPLCGGVRTDLTHLLHGCPRKNKMERKKKEETK